MSITVLHEGSKYTLCHDEAGHFWELTTPNQKSQFAIPGMVVRTNLHGTLHSAALAQGYTKEDFDRELQNAPRVKGRNDDSDDSVETRKSGKVIKIGEGNNGKSKSKIDGMFYRRIKLF
jgi:hypothetical protein